MKSDTAQQLQTALAMSPGATQALAAVAEGAAQAASAQLAAEAALRSASAAKGGGDGASAVVALTAAIRQAEQFDALEEEVEAAEALRERWLRRAEAVEKLEEVMQKVL